MLKMRLTIFFALLPAVLQCFQQKLFIGRMERKQINIRELGSWDAVKAKFSHRVDEMLRHVLFRERHVLGLLTGIQESGLRISWPERIPGSRTLSSDFDVPIWVPQDAGLMHWGDDVKAARLFYDAIKAASGASPGKILDTNIYVDHFSSPGCKSSLYDQSNQAVAALTKVRRYMNEVEWEGFLASVDKHKHVFLVRKIMDATADMDRHEALLTRDLILRFGRSKYNLRDADKKYTWFEKKLYDILRTQGNKKLSRLPLNKKDAMKVVSNVIAEAGPDRILEAEYALYLEGMQRVRAKQVKLQRLLNSNKISEQLRDIRIDEIKHLIADAVYFAPEAYSSEGSFWHIVQYDQSGQQPEVWRKLTHFDLFCSANEQAGDFLKDVNFHYANDPTKALYQSAKYLARFYDAIDKLNQKIRKVDLRDHLAAGADHMAAAFHLEVADYLAVSDHMAVRDYQLTLPPMGDPTSSGRTVDVFLEAVKPLLDIRRSNIADGDKRIAVEKVVAKDEFRELFGQNVAEIQTTVVQHLAKLTAEYGMFFDLRPT